MRVKFATLSSLALAGVLFSPLFADQAPVGPVIGRAVAVAVITTTPPSGPSSTVTTVVQRLVNGSVYDVSFTCPSSLISTYCTPAGVLGPCGRQTATFSDTEPDGTQVTAVVTFCPDPHAGSCQSIDGHVGPNSVLLLDTRAQTGGCQY